MSWKTNPPIKTRRPILSPFPVHSSVLAMAEPAPWTEKAITSQTTKIGVRCRPGILRMQWFDGGRTDTMRRLMRR